MLLNFILLLSALLACGICALAGAFGTTAWLWLLPVSFLGGFLLCLLVCVLLLVVLAIDAEKETRN